MAQLILQLPCSSISKEEKDNINRDIQSVTDKINALKSAYPGWV